MAESDPYSLRGFKGGAAAAQIPGGLNAGVVGAVSADDLSSWAGATANGPIRVMVNRTGATPEEIEVTSVSGNNITIPAGGRGLEGTADTDHGANATIEIVSSPRDFREANKLVAETLGDMSGNGGKAVVVNVAEDGVELADLLPLAGGTLTGDLILAGAPSVDLEAATKKYVDDKRHDTAWSKTVAVQGEVKVPSGAVDYLVPFTVHVESGETLTITKVYDAIRSGTSVTYKLTKNGVDEITGISATTTHNATDVADFTVVDGDRLAVVVTAVSGTPDGLEVTICGTVGSID